MKNLLIILRLHIAMIAVMGALVFGWLMTGRLPVAVALIVGFDWLLVNLLNRVSDVREDLANRIPAAETAQTGRRTIVTAFVFLFGGSLALTQLWLPELTPWRLLMQATGIVYSFRVVPTPRGRVRLKDVYFLKNLMSALGFVTTCFLYPLSTVGWRPVCGWPAVAALMLYFAPFELTYEILYDLRDIEGDRAAGVPTYPVRHGPAVTRRIVQALLGVSIALLAAAFFLRVVGVRELLMAFGPAIQFFALRPLLRRQPTAADCIHVTHLGWAMLALYLISTALWIHAGLPKNLYL